MSHTETTSNAPETEATPWPARIHFILAREADVAVVFRRGPSRVVRLLRWNLKKDSIEPGQWLRKRVYELRSDLSPDGQYLVYFAAAFGTREAYAWTAVSRAPFFTANAFWPRNDTWNGGGLFLDDKTLWINGLSMHGPEEKHAGDRLPWRIVNEHPYPTEWCNNEDHGVYLPRLRRDGWGMVGDERNSSQHRLIFHKPWTRRITLVKIVHAGTSQPGRGCYYDEHSLIRSGGERIDWSGGESADVDHRGRLLCARRGRLFVATWRSGKLTEKEIADLSPMKFEASPPFGKRSR